MSQENIARTILSLHPHKAADVLRRLDEGTLIVVGEAILQHGETHKLTKAAHADTGLRKETEPYNSSLEIVRALYRVAFGAHKSQELVKQLLRRKMKRKLDFLKAYNDDEILQVIQGESPAVMSIVLSAMDSRSAARVLTLLSSPVRAAVIAYIAKQQSPEVSIVEIIEQTLKKKLHELTARESLEGRVGGMTGLSSILEHMDVGAQNALLADLGDDALASQLEESLFSWQLCFDIPQRRVSEILGAFSLYELARIVVLCGDDAYKGIVHGLSVRNKELLEDEIALCKNDPTAKLNTKELQKRLCNALREAAKEYSDAYVGEAVLY